MGYDINFDVKTLSGITAAEYESIFVNTKFSGLGAAFASLEQKYGFSSLFAVAHAAIESGWGTSYYAIYRNELFGIGAFDTDPNSAQASPSMEDNIDMYGQLISFAYLSTPNAAVVKQIGKFKYSQGMYYGGGTTIHDVFIHYSSSHDVEAGNVAQIMNEESTRLGALHTVQAPSGLNNSNTQSDLIVTVTQYPNVGSTLWSIAATYLLDGSKYDQLAKYNGIANANKVSVGQTIRIPRAWLPNSKPTTPTVSTPSVPQQPKAHLYTVKPSDSVDGLSGIAYRELGNANLWPQIAQLNHIAGPRYVIHVGDILTLPS